MTRTLIRFLLLGLLLLVPSVAAQESTPDPEPETTPDPEATPDVVQMFVEGLEEQAIDPPLSIDLPEDWLSGNSVVVVQDVTGFQTVPFTLYTGPVEGGQGFIIVLWGFQTLGDPGNPLIPGDEDFGPYLDALRLLRLALLEPECVVGTEPEREFTVGAVVATGANFVAEQCPVTADTRGWFLGTNQAGVNFAFYMYVEPLEALPGQAAFDMQAVLDTVVFEVEAFLEALVEMAPEATPEADPE